MDGWSLTEKELFLGLGSLSVDQSTLVLIRVQGSKQFCVFFLKQT